MVMAPGKHYVNSVKRLTINFRDENGDDVDPPAVLIKVMSPCGTLTTYTYGEDSEIAKSSVGDYYADIVPNEAGRWHFRWESSGDGTTYDLAEEGSFPVQVSRFYDDIPGYA